MDTSEKMVRDVDLLQKILPPIIVKILSILSLSFFFSFLKVTLAIRQVPTLLDS